MLDDTKIEIEAILSLLIDLQKYRRATWHSMSALKGKDLEITKTMMMMMTAGAPFRVGQTMSS